MGSPVIFKGDLAKILPGRGVELNDGTLILSGTLDPTLVSVDAPAGSMYLSSSTHKVYIKEDSGDTTNWLTPSTGERGPQGDSWQETFETVSKNLKSYPSTLSYTDGALTSVEYDIGNSEIITKTLTYTDSLLTVVTLSDNTPSGIDLIKTLTYTDGMLTAVSYSGG